MATEQGYEDFLAEFEALKAKHGATFADLTVVRFTSDGAQDTPERQFVPYSCRRDDEGFIICVKERPV